MRSGVLRSPVPAADTQRTRIRSKQSRSGLLGCVVAAVRSALGRGGSSRDGSSADRGPQVGLSQMGSVLVALPRHARRAR